MKKLLKHLWSTLCQCINNEDGFVGVAIAAVVAAGASAYAASSSSDAQQQAAAQQAGATAGAQNLTQQQWQQQQANMAPWLASGQGGLNLLNYAMGVTPSAASNTSLPGYWATQITGNYAQDMQNPVINSAVNQAWQQHAQADPGGISAHGGGWYKEEYNKMVANKGSALQSYQNALAQQQQGQTAAQQAAQQHVQHCAMLPCALCSTALHGVQRAGSALRRHCLGAVWGLLHARGGAERGDA